MIITLQKTLALYSKLCPVIYLVQCGLKTSSGKLQKELMFAWKGGEFPMVRDTAAPQPSPGGMPQCPPQPAAERVLALQTPAELFHELTQIPSVW